MQFKYPEIFYFLFILIIPILVHLFQLQKFKKIAFTNVQFLQKISLETRKSSRLKKLLILTARLLGFIAILFTFSQPYFSNKKATEENHNFIYLDNSMSLNTTGKDGNKLRLAAQEIIKYSSEKDRYSLLTNDDISRNISKKDLDNLLKNVKFSAKESSIFEKTLTIESQNKLKSNSLYKNILISDFQNIEKNKNKEFTNVNNLFSLVKLTNRQKNNISIDSVFINTTTTNEISISVIVKNQGDAKINIPIALYNNKRLINKRSFPIEENNVKEIKFSIPKTTTFKGKIQLTYNDILAFDNTFYFAINSRIKTNVLTLGKTASSFAKIFIKEDFSYQHSSLQNVNYNLIPKQQLIILNQLENIPNVLQNSILEFIKNGGHLLIIPDQKTSIESYNLFFRKFSSGKINRLKKDSLKITTINFQHQLFAGVFSKKVTNFQYPSVANSFVTNLKGDKIISFENKSAFLQEIENPFSKIYWFSSPLDNQSTNFSNSPLIVPTLYNIAQQSLEISKPYYILQKENKIDLNEKIEKDEVLKISNSNESFIPLQQSFASKVTLTTNENPKTAGFYSILSQKDTLETIAYNISSNESVLSFDDINILAKTNKNIQAYDSIEQLFQEINEKNEVQWLWKLFLAIAIVSLLLEILILKFFRT
tara:strand:- start:9154 stop:11109 length:1956 start_codon:yes stop_codon:yes gene_type:complete